MFKLSAVLRVQVARILLFVYMFYHVYLHVEQVGFILNLILYGKLVEYIYRKFDVIIITGEQNAHLWISSGFCGACCVRSDESNVVRKDT